MANAVFPAPFATGFRLTDGNQLNAYFANGITASQAAIVAHAGGGKANATPLSTPLNHILTAANAADSVLLPPSQVGLTVLVGNDGANAIQVFGAGTDTVNSVATGTGVSQPAGSVVFYYCTSLGNWHYTVQESGTFTALTTTTLNGNTVPTGTGNLAATASVSDLYIVDVKRTSASVTANATTTYANVTGLSFTVVAGTYRFSLRLPSTVASGTGGIKYAFNYTTTAVSVLEATGIGQAAAASATQHTTTTTTQADLFSQAAVVLFTDIEGTMVVTTGGTVDVQVAQNTSNASNTIALLGGTAEFVRIA